MVCHEQGQPQGEAELPEEVAKQRITLYLPRAGLC
jgi:hypothetical protein